MSHDDEPGTEARSDEALVLAVPRGLVALVLGVAALWLVPLALSLTDGRVVPPHFQAVNVLVGTGLAVFGLDLALLRAQLDAGGIHLRRWGRTRTVSWAEVRGVVLRGDQGTPRLRVATTTGADLRIPAWSLRARHGDGEAEPAAEALERFGATHGVRVRVRTLMSGRPGSRPT